MNLGMKIHFYEFVKMSIYKSDILVCPKDNRPSVPTPEWNASNEINRFLFFLSAEFDIEISELKTTG